MKTLSTILLTITLTFSNWAQDIVVKNNGTKFNAKVIEITSTSIKYRNWEHPDDPIRSIAIDDVEKILYSDGSEDFFEKKTTAKAEVASPRKKDYLFKNGLFIGGIIGISSIHQKYDYTNFKAYYDNGEANTIKPAFQNQIKTCVNFKIGYDWYFGQRLKWRPGFQLTFLNIGVITDFKQSFGMRTMIGAGHVGYSNIFRLNEKSAIECNLKGGVSILDPVNYLSHYNPEAAINYGVEINYRYKVLSVGFDFSRIESGFKSDRYTSINSFSISIGAKF